MTEDATRAASERLLRATRDLYEEEHPNVKLRPGNYVHPYGAAERVGIDPSDAAYAEALAHLEAEGALERDRVDHDPADPHAFFWGTHGDFFLGDD